MTFPMKPCAHCGNAAFHYMPDMRLPVEFASSLLGMNVTKEIRGRYWTFTLVVCDHCGCTQTFTTNGPQLAQWVPGAAPISVPPR